jgi:hypothetical protein
MGLLDEIVARKRVDVAGLAAIEESTPHQLHRLHGGMQIVDLGLVHIPDIALISCATPVVSAAFAPTVQERLVLALIVGTAKRKSILAPNAECGPMPTSLGERFV